MEVVHNILTVLNFVINFLIAKTTWPVGIVVFKGKFKKSRPRGKDDFVSRKYSAVANECDIAKACVPEGGCNVLAQSSVIIQQKSCLMKI